MVAVVRVYGATREDMVLLNEEPLSFAFAASYFHGKVVPVAGKDKVVALVTPMHDV